MATVFAYCLVLFGSSFALTAGTIIGGLPVGMLLFWTPVPVRSRIAGLLAGLVGVGLAALLGVEVFRWLVGPGSFGTAPLLACLLPLIIPISNDYKKAREMKAAAVEGGPRVEQALRSLGAQTAMYSAILGQMLGIAGALGWWMLAA